MVYTLYTCLSQYAMVFLSRYPMGPMASGELCARTLPRVLPSLRPALVAGYQRPGSAAGDGWRSGKTLGKRWGFTGKICGFH